MAIFGYHSEWGTALDWSSFGEYLKGVSEPGSAVNVLPLVGHGTLRLAVMGFSARGATEGELESMKGLLRECCEQGAAGFSTGLEYSPGWYADREELTELCRVVGEYGGFYSSHIRDRAFRFPEAVAEQISVAETSSVPLQLSHLAPRPHTPAGAFERVLESVYGARDRGMRIAFDTLPYTWGPGPVASLLPPGICEGHPDEVLERLRDPTVRESIQAYFDHPSNHLLRSAGWEGLVLTYAPGSSDLVGRSLADIASMPGMGSHADVVCQLLLAEGCDFPHAWLRHVYVREDDLQRMLNEPICMVMSDSAVTAPYGPLADFALMPSSYGLCALVLEEYVRAKRMLTLEEAVRRMTSLPAEMLGLADRGVLLEGCWADIVVFDPVNIRDHATYEQPCHYPSGVEYVLVNGELVVERGQHTGALNGRLLRSSP
jgi:N-acyl-D-amino-acid deacylase